MTIASSLLRAPVLFGLAIFLSGFAALSYQVLWQRALTQTIGSDAVSVALVITIFMVWLGVGAEAGQRLARRSRRQTALLYAAIEVAIGVYGALTIPLIRAVNGWFASAGIDSIWLDFGVNLILLGPPIVGMGMTGPLVIHIVRRQIANLGRTIGLLYGLNILGAGLGAIVSGLVLIEVLGLVRGCFIAGLLNALAGAAAALGARRLASQSEGDPPAAVATVNFGPNGCVAILFGFGTLALQIIFFRILSNYLTLAPTVFPIVLCAYLILMATGQHLGGWLADRYTSRWAEVAAVLFVSGTVLLLAALHFPSEIAAALRVLRFTTFNGSLVGQPELIGDAAVGVAFVFSIAFMLSVVAWSALFPLLMRIVTPSVDMAGANFGRLYVLYTVGNVAGAFVTGIFLLPALGTGGTAAVTVLVVAIGTWKLVVGMKGGLAPARNSARTAGYVVASALLVLAVPRSYYSSFNLGAYRIVDVFEGRTGVATVVPTKQFYWIVDMNRTASASALVRDPGLDDQYEAWRWNHTELFALDSQFRPKRILVIGLGHAYLVDALLDLSFVEKIVVVELSDEIVAAVKKHTRTATRRVFEDPRVEIVIADGRRYVQSALSRGDRFDLVQLKINEPWHAGAGNLFTVEFFDLIKRVLTPGGYLGVRPLVGHLSDGLRVFPSSIYPGYYHLFFKNGLAQRSGHGLITDDIREAWHRRLPGDPKADLARDDELRVIFLDQVPAELITDINSDDSPMFEYYWLRQKLGRWKSPRDSLDGSKFDKYRESVTVVGARRDQSEPSSR